MKKSIWSILAAFVLLFSATGSAWAYAPSFVHKSGTLAYEHTKYLSEEIGSRVTGTEGESLAKEYIKKQFEDTGYNPDVQEFSFTKRGTSLSSSNVIAIKQGQSPKQIIVGAHYDSVKTGKGADDNASGVGVMLEAAQVLQKVSTPYTIVFIAFGAEEGGLNGSNYYASQMTAAEIDNTIGMINLDSLAVGDKMYVHGGADDAGFIREQALNIAEKRKLDIGINPGLNEHYPAGTTGDWSDHAPFNELGIPFAYFESTNWEIGELDGYEQTMEYGGVWHTENDTLTFIETAYPGRIQERLYSYSQVLSELLKHFDKTSTSK